MNSAELAALAEAVQFNCDIADARHAADMTLCTYLLQMREFYRWSRGAALGARLARDEVGAWIAEREGRWAAIEGREFAALTVQDGAAPFDPFDAEGINRLLEPHGLLYGAGLVARRRPVFFLAELHDRGEREGLAVLQAGRELARTLLAPPAVLAGGGAGPIVLRRESLERWGHERIEAFALRPQPGSALQAMIEVYALDERRPGAWPRWLDDQLETATLHELGEYRVGRWLGDRWQALRRALPHERADAHARALRDLLADLSVTLPTLLERGDPAPLHAWFAAHDGLPALLAPQLGQAYAAWRGGGRHLLRQAIDSALDRFETTARELIDLWSRDGAAAAARIEVALLALSVRGG